LVFCRGPGGAGRETSFVAWIQVFLNSNEETLSGVAKVRGYVAGQVGARPDHEVLVATQAQETRDLIRILAGGLLEVGQRCPAAAMLFTTMR
jgi:hypothetical protein